MKNNTLKLQTQKRYIRYNAFTEEINNITLSLNDKRMESIDSIETYPNDLVSEKEEIKCNSVIKRYTND